MADIISVRTTKRIEEMIGKFAEESKLEKSDLIRRLIEQGGIFLAIQAYSEGHHSIEKASHLAGLPLSEFIDLVTRLGIRSKMDLHDMLDASAYLDSLERDNGR